MPGKHRNRHRQSAATNDASSRVRRALPTWKRALDIACLIFAAPALIGLMGIIAVLIRISSRGPVLFRQERIGLGGKPFSCFKFRTMKHGGENAATSSHEEYLKSLVGSDRPMRKRDLQDGRVLPIGFLLRASGLDELPQVFNIMRGEMSLVGPRPCLRCEYEEYSPEQRERFQAVPGLTGLWQVSGKNETTFQEMIDFDITYSRNLSLAQDIAILFRTFPVLFRQSTATLENKRYRNFASVHDQPVRKRQVRPLTTV